MTTETIGQRFVRHMTDSHTPLDIALMLLSKLDRAGVDLNEQVGAEDDYWMWWR